MKKVFLLGLGVGFILSGIMFYFLKENDKTINLVPVDKLIYENKEENKEIEYGEKLVEEEKKEDEKSKKIITEEIITENKSSNKKEKTSKVEKNKKIETQNNKEELSFIDEKKEEAKDYKKIKEISNEKSNDNKMIVEKEESFENKKDYIIQLGAFKEELNAKVLLKKIPELELRITKDDSIYRVVTSKFREKKEAEKIVVYILEKYKIKTYIKELN